MSWFKKTVVRSAQRQCKFNIRLSTRTLVDRAVRVLKDLEAGGIFEECCKPMMKAQVDLYKDMQIAVSNGLTVDEIERKIITPELEKRRDKLNPLALSMVEDSIKSMWKKQE